MLRPASVAPALVVVLAAGAFACGGGSDADCSGDDCSPAAPVATPPVPAPPAAAPGEPAAPPSATDTGQGEAPAPDLPLAGNPEAPPVPAAPEPPAGPPAPPLFGDPRAILDGSLRFYGAQRSGDGANWLLSGGTCHMNDGESIGADLAGGWYDAGDHLKPTLSIAYASYVMLKAYDAFPEAFNDNYGERYEAPNGVPDVLDEARYATDYLVKAHVSQDELVGMIGSTQPDHAEWVGCAAQEALPPTSGGRPRPVSMNANADIAGITAASLAIMSRLYRPFNPELADSYQTHATQIYQIGKDNPTGSNPGLYGQQGATAWFDEMLAGSAELYRLTSAETYLTDALDFNARIEDQGWTPHWGQSADYSRHSLYVGGAADAVADFWRLDVENYAAKVSTNEFTVGAVYFDEWGMLRHAAAAAFSAALYSQVTGDIAARDLAISQLNYIAGQNSYDRSFVIGIGTNAPQNPHHRNSDTLGVLLTGGLVAGPTQRTFMQGQLVITAPGYEDVTEDYVGNEVALDYNAGLVGLSAFGVLQQRIATTIQ